ncbi:MAG: ATP-binding protein [Bacteroidia bacterium]
MHFENFQVGKPVTGKDFIGREEELKLMLQLLAQGQSIVLIAPRRYGKTSLVREVLRRLDNKRFYTSYIDLFSNPTMDGLAADITQEVLSNKRLDKAFSQFMKNIKEIVKNVEFRHEVDQNEFILHFNNPHHNANELLSESVDFIERFAKKNDKHIITAFDEFGDLAKYGSDKIVKLFRSKMQTHKHATYIFSGSYESVMNELFVSPRSPFYRFARIIQLRGINKDTLSGHIINKLKENKQSITDDALNLLYDFTVGHPYYTQLMLQQIVLFYQDKKVIDKKEVEQIKKDLLVIEMNYIEKTWEELSKIKESVPVLLALASKQQSIYTATARHPVNTSRALRKLVNNGIIYKQDSSYHFNDPLLQYWITENLIR